MMQWAIVIYDSECLKDNNHIIYRCSTEKEAKEFVINTMDHYQTCEYLADDSCEYKLLGYEDGSLQFRMIEANGGITEVCAIKIIDEVLNEIKVMACFNSFSHPRVFSVEAEEDRLMRMRLLKSRYLSTKKRNHVSLDENKTIVLLDDESIQNDEGYFYLYFTDGNYIVGNIVDIEDLNSRERYDCTE